MEEKIKWTYSAKIQGGTRLQGSLMASNAEEATKLIKQFGFLDWKLTDPAGVVVEAEPEPEKPSPAIPAPMPAMPTPITPRLVPPSVQQPSMAPSNPPKRERNRFQRVIAGPQKEVLPSLQDALNKPNAKVMHVCMHPDAHGTMWFVYVVEIDEEEIK